MGMFNYIYVDCPECGETVEFQSKSGSCTLAQYSIKYMPVDDIAGILGDVEACSCGHSVAIDGNQHQTRRDDFSHLVT